VESARRRIFGVDFSGARDAARAIWIAEARSVRGGLEIERCRPLRAGGANGRTPAECCAELAALIASSPGAVFGFDFPFSLTRPLIPDTHWDDWVLAFPRRFPTADAFRADCRARTNGREPKRATDTAAKTPWGCFNLKLYRQTYYGVGHLLHALVRARSAAIVPMQPPAPELPWVIEVCPASFLKAEGLYRPYKGRAGARRSSRESILRALTGRHRLRPLAPEIEKAALDNAGGDARDSIIAAVATHRVVAAGAVRAAADPLEAIEGRVYF
jgi:hypothetical protein